MLRNWLKLSTDPLLATALWMTGCSDQAPSERLVGPESASYAKGGKSTQTKGGRGRVVKETTSNGTSASWKIVTGKLPTTNSDSVSVKGIIGAEGGTLQLPGINHVLYVTRNAVAEPTYFKMTQVRQPVGDGSVEVIVHLKAYKVVDGQVTTTSVGELGFKAPVYLGLSYAWANEVTDGNASSASILYLKAADTVEAQKTFTVDYGAKWIVTELLHFSEYGIGCPMD